MSGDLQKCLKELDKIPNAETRRRAEKLHRQLSHMSAEDLFKPFTI
jgi:hypothetical protein